MPRKVKRKAGAPKGNLNALKHGFYSKVLDEAEMFDMEAAADVNGIDDEIALLRVKIKSVLERDPENIKLIMQATNTLAGLVKTRYNMTGQQRRGLREAMALPMGDMGVNQALACGIYENDFIKEDGVWKLWKIKWVPVYSGTPARGWVKEERVAEQRPPVEGEEMRLPEWWQSDKPARGIDYGYPSGYILPFHFKHPVTGKATAEGERNKRVKGVKG